MSTGKTKRISILGSTGSIGRQTLDVIRENPDLFKVISLTANTNAELLLLQKQEFGAVYAGLTGVAEAKNIPKGLHSDENVIIDAVLQGVDVVVVATAGISALRAVFAAIDSGIDVAIANKESIIACGELINERLKGSTSRLIPIDSEHSAIFQCLVNSHSKPSKIILTASGGPFRGLTGKDLNAVTAETALKHPKWSMGKKITVDSATMMNKGFEIIEASYLFGLPGDKIEVLVHPQSIIHSMVEFVDKTVMANLSLPDMRIPIQYALTFPERVGYNGKSLSLTEVGSLEFFSPDDLTFPTMKFARAALRKGGGAPLTLCGADEAAVKAFLNKAIAFTDIFSILKKVADSYSSPRINSCSDAYEIFSDVIRFTESIINQIK